MKRHIRRDAAGPHPLRHPARDGDMELARFFREVEVLAREIQATYGGRHELP